MADGFVQINEGTGKKLHSSNRTIGANDVHDEYVLLAEPHLPTYIISGSQSAAAAANDHIGQIMAGASLLVRVRRVLVRQHAVPAGVTAMEHQLVRLTTAGTGGTAITARPFDTGAAAAGATGIAVPGVKGTEGAILLRRSFWLGTAAIPVAPNFWEWVEAPNAQPIIIPAGITNGLAIKAITGGTATFSWEIEFTEANY